MSLPRFHKLYFPGLISSICLPILCVCYLESHNLFQKYGAMVIVAADKKSLEKWSELSGKNHNVELFRRYKDVGFSGRFAADKIKLDEISLLISQLTTTNDTINGIRVSFGNHATYAEFVSVLDVCYQSINHHLGFVPYEGKILIWHLPALNPELLRKGKNLDNDHVFIDNILPEKAKKTLSVPEKFVADLNTIYKTLIEFWPSVLTFILMIGFAVFKSRRYLSLQSFRLTGAARGLHRRDAMHCI
jgi:hypothetical protein